MNHIPVTIILFALPFLVGGFILGLRRLSPDFLSAPARTRAVAALAFLLAGASALVGFLVGFVPGAAVRARTSVDERLVETAVSNYFSVYGRWPLSGSSGSGLDVTIGPSSWQRLCTTLTGADPLENAKGFAFVNPKTANWDSLTNAREYRYVVSIDGDADGFFDAHLRIPTNGRRVLVWYCNPSPTR